MYISRKSTCVLKYFNTVADFQPHSHLPYGKQGSSNYSENAVTEFDIIKAATPLTLSAAGNLFIYLVLYITPSTLSVILRRIVGRAEEGSVL